MQAQLCEQEAATAEQSACAQKLQDAVETGKGKLAESAAFMQKLQDEQIKAKEQIAEYAGQVRTFSWPLLTATQQLVCPDALLSMTLLQPLIISPV